MKVPLLDLRQQYQPLREEIRQAIDAVCDAQALILGPAVERFEANLAKYCQTKHAIGVSSGTDALLCALMALSIQADDEVICPSFTFFATAGSIARLGATPVFADIDPATFNLAPADVEHRITRKTKAILPVHLFGQCADTTALSTIARRHGLPLIEDAAQAIGAEHHGKRACSMGLAGCLSFYPTKNLGAFGDAGAICTNDDDFAQRCRLLRVHGSGHTYHHELIGGMFRLAAIQAAVLEVKLKYLDDWHHARQRNAALYDELLQDAPMIRPTIAPGNRSVFNQYVIRISDGKRDAVKQHLADRGIGSAVYYPEALHRQPCFAYLNAADQPLPETDRACREVLALPIYPELTEGQIRYVAAELRNTIAT